MLKPLYTLFSYLMKGCLYISGNSYLLALLFFALAIEIILIPLAIKQQKSQIKMAEIKPKEMAIREKYKGRNDRTTQQKMTMEIQEMYQQNGYNQFAGCLPLLIQLPIIFILFAIVRNPITYASNVENFDLTAASTATVEFYQTEKEMLVKDAFKNEAEYNEFIKLLENNQITVGGKKQDEQKDGLNVFAYDPNVKVAENELVISRLIIDGREDLQELIDEGKIDASILTIYDETGLEAYNKDGQMPNYRFAGVNLLNEPDFNKNIILMLIPLIVFLSSYLSTKLMRKFSGSAQQVDANGNPVGGGLFMEVGMPLISAMIAYGMPAAIGAYWIWRTFVSIGKSFIMAKAMPIPAVTDEMIAEARREMKTKVKKKKTITIEVDEDDDSYDSMIVGGSPKKTVTQDVTTRTPRKIEMLSADDEDE